MGNGDSTPARTVSDSVPMNPSEYFVCVVHREKDIPEVEQKEDDMFLEKGFSVDIIECQVANKSECMEDMEDYSL